VSPLLLLVAVLAFAWSIGAHYTGACMGMPFASGSVRLWPALVMMAVLAMMGATVASHGVERTVGLDLVAARHVTVGAGLIIILVGFLLTTVYTTLRVPTSTIQILVFSLAGVALGARIQVDWATVARLAVIWVLAPPVASGLGYAFTKGLDRLGVGRPRPGGPGAGTRPGVWPLLLVAVGALASFTMGANDVSNATGVLVMTRSFNVWMAGFLGGIGLVVGVLTWGKPLLKTVAFDIVHVDLAMATAAQFVQALVVLMAVSLGLFTSMNQALVGAMTGAGLARGEGKVEWGTVKNIVKGWLIGAPSGLVLGFLAARLLAPWVPL
jgi:PiT family inorganic phosphate transporter